MKVIRAIDEAILSAGDALVLFVWNTFEVRHAWLTRAGWLTIFGLSIANHKSWSVLAACGIALLLNEFVWRRGNNVYNAVTAAQRGAMPWVIIRMTMIPWNMYDVVSDLAHGRMWAAWYGVACLATLLVQWSFTPTDPPKRREPKLAPARGAA